MRLLVTAGPTHEPIDAVRYLANRSSGKMGFALAEAAAARGWQVVLVAGPVGLTTPAGVQRVDVTTAEEMATAVHDLLAVCDAAILAAAVADFRPAHPAVGKLKKTDGVPEITLVPTTDILASCRGWGFTGLLVGFAAETDDLVRHARAKLEGKGCDLVVANDVSRTDIGFGSEDNEVVLVTAEGETPVARASKEAIAGVVLDRMEEMGGARGRPPNL